MWSAAPNGARPLSRGSLVPSRTTRSSEVDIGWSTGYSENYWGDWMTAPQIGGSERIVVEIAAALAAQDHRVTVRLPYRADETVWRGVRWLGVDAPGQRYDVLLCADDYARRDHGVRTCLVACRSDPAVHRDFDARIYLSRTHAELMGDAGAPYVGGGVDLADYAQERKRVARRVICTSSPDRCPAASAIGKAFDFVHTYRPVSGVGQELDRAALIGVQQTARVHIYPLDPARPSDFFSMSVLESHAAGTPVIVSDRDSMPELWSDSAWIIPGAVRLAEWDEAVLELLSNRSLWRRYSETGRAKAQQYTWDLQAARYLSIAREA